MFVPTKRGGPLEAEFIISYTEAVSEVIHAVHAHISGTREVLSPPSMLVIRAWQEWSGWMLYKPQAFSDGSVTDKRHKS